MPNTQNAWDNENHQRRCISRGIDKLDLSEDDIIIISDVDEVPDIKTLATIKNNGINEVFSLEQDFYYYNLSCKMIKQKCYHAKIMSYKSFVINNKDPEKIRMSQAQAIQNGGWHFSYFGSISFIKNKLQNFSHQEFNSQEYLDEQKIEKAITKGKDLFNRRKGKFNHRQAVKFKKIKIEDNEYLPNNYELLL